MSLRTAVVGGGTISDRHLDGLTACPETTLAAICDVDADRARAIAAEYGITGYTDVETMIDDAGLDWAHICTPVGTHLELATTFVEAGIPVLVQKPITETVAEFEELEATAEAHDVPVSAVHNHNFDPAMRELTDALASGAVGTVRSVTVRYAGETYPDDVRRGDWAFDLPGGEFEEGLPHPLYLLLRAGGYPADEDAIDVRTQLVDSYDRPFTYDGLTLQYASENDVLCSATLLPSSVPDKGVYVHGDDGALLADLVSQTLVTLDRDYQASPIARARNNLDRAIDRIAGNVRNVRRVLARTRNDDWETQTTMDSHAYQFEREALALRGRGDPPVPLAEAGWTIRLMAAIREAAETPAVAPDAQLSQ